MNRRVKTAVAAASLGLLGATAWWLSGPPDPVDCVGLDFDLDGDVDGVDFAVFASCFNKSDHAPRSDGCTRQQASLCDNDTDGDVDAADFVALIVCYGGAGKPPRDCRYTDQVTVYATSASEGYWVGAQFPGGTNTWRILHKKDRGYEYALHLTVNRDGRVLGWRLSGPDEGTIEIKAVGELLARMFTDPPPSLDGRRDRKG